MRMTARSNLAMRTLMYCAVNEARTVRKTEIATGCNVSENHLAQVVSRLGKSGLLKTVRGRGGGIRLGRPTSEISVGEVVRLFETDTRFAECFDSGANTCPITPHCRLKCAIAGALAAFYAYLDDVRLSDLVADNDGLNALLMAGAAA